jgi:hypothetical protein
MNEEAQEPIRGEAEEGDLNKSRQERIDGRKLNYKFTLLLSFEKL